MSQRADLILVSARIWDGTELAADAIAIADGLVVATGSSREILGLVSEATEVLDAGGRRVIPGLIDSHIHMIRAGLTWNEEVRWETVGSLHQGLDSISGRADAVEPGRWIAAVGGWHPSKLAEGRPPERADLDGVAPDHPVFVQRNYVEAFMNSRALQEMGWMEQHPDGHVTDPAAMAALRDKLHRGDPESQVAATADMLRELNRHGLTGAIDAAGFGMSKASYDPLFRLFSGTERGFRIRLLVGASRPGAENDDLATWIGEVSPGQGDDFVRYLGAGEVLLYAAHDMEGLHPKDISAHVPDLAGLSAHLADRGWPTHVHAILDSSVGSVLDAWEKVSRSSRLADLRFTICHADQVGEENLRRIEDMGLGVTVQAGMAFRRGDSARSWTESQLRASPPLRRLLDLGVPVGAGSDGTVAASFHPWQCIQWMVSGEAVDGSAARDEEQRLGIEEALRLYTRGSAWFSFEEQTRGNLRVGSHADLAVLTADPLRVSPQSLAAIESVMTIVGGEVVHTTGEAGKVQS